MTIAKDMWLKPEMIILVRSNPEESVLDFCKTYGKDGPGQGKCNQGVEGKDVHCDNNADS